MSFNGNSPESDDKLVEGLIYKSVFDPYIVAEMPSDPATSPQSNKSNSWEEMPTNAAGTRNASITEFNRQKNLHAKEHVKVELDRLVDTLEEGLAKKVLDTDS